MKKYEVIFVLGGPGSGKGTQCELLEKEYNVKHISVGDLLRIEQSKQPPTKFGNLIKEYITNGKIVPVDISLNLLINTMKETGNDKIFLIDGFPRNKDNIDGWNDKMSQICEIKSIIFYKCQEKELIRRIKLRSQDSNREDDKDEIIKKRLQVYYNDTVPIIEYYTKIDKVLSINSQDASIEGVYSITTNKLQHILSRKH